MSRIVTFLICLIFSIPSRANPEDPSYSGIWQDAEQSSDYYVIQENGDSIVLIALPGIEAYADTLRFSFIGDKSDLVLTRLSEEEHDDIFGRVQLQFESPEQGSFHPICEACTVITVNIVKIF